VKIKDQLIEVKNNHFTINNKVLAGRDLKVFKSFLKNFIPSKSNPTGHKIKNMPSDIQLLYHGAPLIYKKETFFINDSTQMGPADFLTLRTLAQNVQLGRVDLVPLGEIGKDFKIWFKGEELIMDGRNLKRKSGKELSAHDLDEAQTSRDNASGFLFILAYAHLAHIFVALLYLLKIVIRTFRNNFSSENNLSLRLTAIFWHFLGLLWGYLILFLVFIH
jgi:cytochrome c oxidase subunit 3